MEKYGRNLETMFTNYDQRFSDKTILQIGIKLLEIMEKIHESGYTYNDLKLDNILVGDVDQTLERMHEIRLIDFGFAERFRDKEGNHIEEKDV